MRSAISDISVSFGSRAVTLVLGIAIQSCLAWYLGPAGRGSYAVCMAYTALLAVCFNCGIDGAGQYHVASKKLTPSEGVSAMLVLQTVGGLLAVVVGLAVIRLPLDFFEKAPKEALILSASWVPFFIWHGALLLILGAMREFPCRALLSGVASLVRLAITFVTIGLFSWGVIGAVTANALAMMLTAGLAMMFLIRRHRLHWVRPSWRCLRGMIGYGGRYYFAAFSTLVSFQIGTIMLTFFATKREIGLFAQMATLVLYVTFVADIIGSVIHPRIASDSGGRPELAAQGARVAGCIAAVVLVFLAVFAKPIVAIVFSPEFLPAVPLIWIMVPGVIVRASTKVLVHYMTATNHPGTFSFSAITSTVVNFSLLLILLPTMGLNGAAWAMCIAHLCGGAGLVVAFRIYSGVSMSLSWLPRWTDWDLALGVIRKARAKLGGTR